MLAPYLLILLVILHAETNNILSNTQLRNMKSFHESAKISRGISDQKREGGEERIFSGKIKTSHIQI